MASSAVHADWNDKGKWRGKLAGGWAGGAAILSASASTLPQRPNRADLEIGQRQIPNQLAQNMAPDISVPGNDELREVTETRAPVATNALYTISILRTKKQRSPPGKRKIRFEASYSERFYNIDSESCKWLVPSSDSRYSMARKRTPVASGTSMATVSASIDAFVAAIRKKDLMGVLQQLKSGNIRTDATIEGVPLLEREYIYAKEHGLSAITKILNVYKTAATSILAAQSLRLWHRYEIRVDKIIHLQLRQGGLPPPGLQTFEGCVSHRVQGRYQNLPALPHRTWPTRGVVEYGLGNSSLPEYALNYNDMLAEDRTFVIDLRSTGNGKSIATLAIPVKEISSEALGSGGSVVIEKELQVGNLLKQRASVRLLVKRINLEQDYLSKYTARFCNIRLGYCSHKYNLNTDAAHC